MKIAIVFSGQPRFVDQNGYHSTKAYFLDKYDCDIYAHFWFEKGSIYETSPWTTLGDITLPDDTIEKFIDLYKPKGIKIEKPMSEQELLHRNYTNTSSPRTPYNTFSMYCSHKRAFDLIPNPEEYDFIIRQRTDNIVLYMPDLDILSKDHIYYITQCEKRHVYNDSFAIFPGKYAHYFFHGIEILDTLYDNGCFFNNENLFRELLSFYNLAPLCRTFSLSEFNFAFQRNNRIEICRA